MSRSITVCFIGLTNETDLNRGWRNSPLVHYVAGRIRKKLCFPARAHFQLQIAKKEEPARKKKSIWMNGWLQRRMCKWQYGGRTQRRRHKGLQNSHGLFRELVERVGPTLLHCYAEVWAWNDDRAEQKPSIFKYRLWWSRVSENQPWSPWHNSAVSEAYPLHIRFISGAFPWSPGLTFSFMSTLTILLMFVTFGQVFWVQCSSP